MTALQSDVAQAFQSRVAGFGGFPTASSSPGTRKSLEPADKNVFATSNALAVGEFYNSLEAPAFDKFPILQLYKEFLRANGALVSLMSGSGSTTFAIAENLAAAENLAEKFKSQFGDKGWTSTVAI